MKPCAWPGGTRRCSSSSLHPLNWHLCVVHSPNRHVWQPCPGLSSDPVPFESCHATPRLGGAASPADVSSTQWVSGRVRIRGSEKAQNWGHRIQAPHFTDEETDGQVAEDTYGVRERNCWLAGLPAQFTCHPEGACSLTVCRRFRGVLSQTARTSRPPPGPACWHD